MTYFYHNFSLFVLHIPVKLSKETFSYNRWGGIIVASTPSNTKPLFTAISSVEKPSSHQVPDRMEGGTGTASEPTTGGLGPTAP